jgi:cytoskeletal protein RodZ
MTGGEDRVMGSINHRPRRLGAPLAAVGAVTVLIVILIVTGLHTNGPAHHPPQSNTATTTRTHQRPAGPHATTASTTTTAAPTVSAPTAVTAHRATYQVTGASYSLALAATAGECWLDVTDTATGAVLFTGTLFSGQTHTVAATGPVTVIAGAPAAFSAAVNGSAVTLPPGYQAPFTLTFQTAQPA